MRRKNESKVKALTSKGVSSPFKLSFLLLSFFLFLSLVSAQFGYDYANNGVNQITQQIFNFSGSLTNFYQLNDTPNSYSGFSNYCLRVNGGETGLEFFTCPSGGGGSVDSVTSSNGWISVNPTTGDVILNFNQTLNNETIRTISSNFNETAIILSVNTTSNIMNLGFYNKSEVDGLIAGAGNASFNQTLTDMLYYSVNNPSNFINVTSGQFFNNTGLILSVNNSLWNYIINNESAWLSTFNTTYNNVLGQNCPGGQFQNGTLSDGTLICNSVSVGSVQNLTNVAFVNETNNFLANQTITGNLTVSQIVFANLFSGSLSWLNLISVPDIIYGIWSTQNVNNLIVSNGTAIGYNDTILNNTIAEVGVAIGFNNSGGSVDSVSSGDKYLIIAPTTGDVVGIVNETFLNMTISDLGVKVGLNNTFNATYAVFAYNQTTSAISYADATFVPSGSVDAWVIKYQNISNLPTCSVGDFLFFNGTVLSCETPSSSGIQNNTAGLILNFTNIYSDDWTNVSITLSQVSDFVESDLNVNSSDFWDDYDVTNSTQFENNGGTLNIIHSWLVALIDSRINSLATNFFRIQNGYITNSTTNGINTTNIVAERNISVSGILCLNPPYCSTFANASGMYWNNGTNYNINNGSTTIWN